MRSNRDKKRVAELRRRARKVVSWRPSDDGWSTKKVTDGGLSVELSTIGEVTVLLNGSMVYMIRSDGYEPYVHIRGTRLDEVIQRLRQMLVLDDLADV